MTVLYIYLVALFIWLINIDINKGVLTVNKHFFIVLFDAAGFITLSSFYALIICVDHII